MAALRRLIPAFNNISKTREYALGKQLPETLKTLKRVAAGLCVTTGAGIAWYFALVDGKRSGLASHVEARVVHLALPSVAATDKARPYDLDDGDVYMSSFENRFRLFSSVEYEGQLFMTPLNFIESVTLNEPKGRRIWKSLTKKELEKILAETPPACKGSSNLFRNLRERGIISYTEYLFLLCILTKPRAGFKIAFNMFDADGNEMVDKNEFLVLEDIFRKKKDRKEVAEDTHRSDQQSLQLYGHQKPCAHSARGLGGAVAEYWTVLAATSDLCTDLLSELGKLWAWRFHFKNLLPEVFKKGGQNVETRGMWDVLKRGTSQILFSDLTEHMDDNTTETTTLLVHFFGKKGKAELNFEDFYTFMDNLQTEMLEIEFLSYSKGMPTISEEDFAQILLRYTNVENISGYLENLRQSIPDEKGIAFEEFRSFFQFLNNLEDFTIAMQMYNFANRSVGQDEFTRAVYVATGLKLTRHVVDTVFKIFDEDRDNKLSYKEFIGVMKDRLHRGERGIRVEEKFTSFKSCLKKELSKK